jgi:acyl carrier protein
MEMNDTVIERIILTIVDELCIDDVNINRNTKLSSELEINSLELLNVVMVLEEDFEVTFEEERVKKLKTVGDIAEYIEELKK